MKLECRHHSTPDFLEDYGGTVAGRGSPRYRSLLALAVAVLAVSSTLAVLAHGSGSEPSADLRSSLSNPTADVTYSWTDVSSIAGAAPSPRSGTQEAYSPTLGKVVLFGGYAPTVNPDGDTWAFGSDHWSEVTASIAPPGRWGGAMVYDAADGYLLLFGGRNDTQFFDDTWSYDATGWHQIVTSVAPSPRSNFGLVYDPVDRDVILFGGGMGNVPVGSGSPWSYYSDTWTYHAGVWTNVTPSAAVPPSPRWVGGMNYDASVGAVLLEGGAGSTACSLYDDTWEFSGGQWTELSPAHAPPASALGGTVFDTQTNNTLLFQGLSFLPGCTDDFVNQVWAFSNGDWSLSALSSVSAPAGRASPAWVDDPTDHGELLFGGDYSGVYASDTWILTSSSQPTSGGPAVTGVVSPGVVILGSILLVALCMGAIATWVWKRNRPPATSVGPYSPVRLPPPPLP